MLCVLKKVDRTLYILGPHLTFDAWVTLGELLSVLAPQFLYLYNGDKAGTYHIALQGLN